MAAARQVCDGRSHHTSIIITEPVGPCGSKKSQNGKKNSKAQITPMPRKEKHQRRNKRLQQCVDRSCTSAGVYKEHGKTISMTNNENEEINNSRMEVEDENVHQNANLCGIQNNNSVRFYCLQNKVVVVIGKNSRLCFTGKLVLKVIYGIADVYGTIITPRNGPLEVYSPRGYSSVIIETRSEPIEQTETSVWSELAEADICQDDWDILVDEFDNLEAGTTVIVLWNLENKLTRFLQAFYPFRLFPKIKNVPYTTCTDVKRAEAILQSNFYFSSSNCKDLIFDRSLTSDIVEKALDHWHANQRSCILVAGGKGVGKSTTMRYLINNLIRSSGTVVLFDVDPGQAECTPPACISYSLIDQPLLGPNFTHLKMPVYQLYIGDVNVSRCITRYIEGVKMMADRLTNCPDLSRLPIVVNTMGFTQGIGWDIMLFTIKLLRPNLVLQIMSDRPKNNYPELLDKEFVNSQKLSWAAWSTSVIDSNQPCDHELHVIQSQAERRNPAGSEIWNMEPYQQRELTMISYFSEIIQCSSAFSELPLSINSAVPYVASFSSLSISIPRACVPPSHTLSVINGNIVALCGINATTNDYDETTAEASCSPRILTRAPLCTCYGFGIVRGVDVDRQEVFINTPVPSIIMQFVNCLIGCIPVPATLLQLNNFKNVPYTGGNDVLPTSREPRRGYFRMRYQNEPGDGD